MEIIKLSYPHDLVKGGIADTVAAIGSFDGIHLGHQKVIETAVREAVRQRKKSSVISFYPHPSVVLRNQGEAVKYITPEPEKIRILTELKVDRLYMIHFDEAFSKLSPSQFIESFIIGLHITHLVAGFDFRFAHKGSGNMDNVHEFSRGLFTTEIVDKVENSNGKVGSSQIRAALECGEISKVNSELGRVFETAGVVVTGDKRGRTIGFPTANLDVAVDALLPKQGVYAVRVIVRGETYQGMANLGVVPTFKAGETKPTLEVYIFDFDADIYGQEVRVLWYEFIRDEQKFNGIDAIVKQLTADEESIRDFFEEM